MITGLALPGRQQQAVQAGLAAGSTTPVEHVSFA
jgi:hypothetical protein